MCVIIDMPVNVTLSWDILKGCMDRNGDGYGIMGFDSAGKFQVIRSMGGFESFKDDFKKYPRTGRRVIHFRMASKGEKRLDNCHPFLITGSHIKDKDGNPVSYDRSPIWMVHNGTITGYPEVDKARSDTYHFAEHNLGPVVPTWGDAIARADFLEMIEDITKGSKILFMDESGRVARTFDKQWHKEYGCYFSNSYSLPWKNTYTGRKAKKKKGGAITGLWDSNRLGFGDEWGSDGTYYYSKGRKVYYTWQDGLRWDVSAQGYVEAETDNTEPLTTEPLTFDDFCALSESDMADYIQDSPWDAVDFINQLMELAALNGAVGINPDSGRVVKLPAVNGGGAAGVSGGNLIDRVEAELKDAQARMTDAASDAAEDLTAKKDDVA